MNDNRIVRVRNEIIHDLLEFVSNYEKVPYQHVFDAWCDLMANGYTTGTHTNVILIDEVRKRKK